MKTILPLKPLGLLLAAGLWLVACGARPTATTTPTFTPSPIPPTPGGFVLATLAELTPTVQVNLGGGFVPALPGAELTAGSNLFTGSGGRARINYTGTGTIIRLADNSALTLRERTTRDGNPLDGIILSNGQAWVAVNWGAVEVETPIGLVTIAGSFASVNYAPGDPATFDDDVLNIECVEGQCALSRGGSTAILNRMERFTLTSATLVRSTLTDSDVANFLQVNPESTRIAVTLTSIAPTWTPTPTPTQTPTTTSSPTITLTSAPTLTPTRTKLPTARPSSTPTRTITFTPTVTPTRTATPTITLTRTITPTTTASLTRTATSTITATGVGTSTATATGTGTPTLTSTPTSTSTVTPTPTSTPTATATPASPLVVNSTADEVDISPGDNVCLSAGGFCTLRAAIMEANARLGPQTINLPAGAYGLSLSGTDDTAAAGDLDITDALTVVGAGATSTSIDGAGLGTPDRLFHIVTPGLNVAFSDLAILNGLIASDYGGGLLNNGGALNLTRVRVHDNGSMSGGGIANRNGGLLTLFEVTLDINDFTGQGGGLYNEGQASLDRVTLADNLGTGVLAQGGAIFNSGTLTLTNVTLSHNAANGSTTAEGGGLYNGGTATLNFVTLADNTAIAGGTTHVGDNIFHGGGSITLLGTLVIGGGATNCNTMVTASFSLEDNPTPVCVSGATNLNVALGGALLDVLGPYGGFSETRRLLAGSPAIDAGGPTCPNADQRGSPRPQNGVCDIGAYEFP